MKAAKNWIKRNFTGLLYNGKKKPAGKQSMEKWLEQFANRRLTRLSDTSYDIFTYHGEDGIIAYLLRQLKEVPPVFVDIGAGNCITGNCSMLAVHFGWQGLFIDKDPRQLSTGRKFYKDMLKGGRDIQFIAEEVSAENINDILTRAGINKETGLLSIDIDGNDYWIWKAIRVIQPRVVVIEAKVEFGHHDVIVPYGPDNHRSVNLQYNGASVEALRKLGREKGYKLAGANRQGYNLFFVREDEDIPAVTVEEVLHHPSAVSSFYATSFFNKHKFVT